MCGDDVKEIKEKWCELPKFVVCSREQGGGRAIPTRMDNDTNRLDGIFFFELFWLL